MLDEIESLYQNKIIVEQELNLKRNEIIQAVKELIVELIKVTVDDKDKDEQSIISEID